MAGAIDKYDRNADDRHGTNPLDPQHHPPRLDALVEKADAADAYGQLHLLAAALEEAARPGNPLADNWRRLAVDLSLRLAQEPESSLLPGGLDETRKMAGRALIALLTRIADGSISPSVYSDAAETLMEALVKSRVAAREEATAVEIKSEEDLKRFRRSMEDNLPVALIAALALTRRSLQQITEATRFPALEAGLKAGLEIATSKLKPSGFTDSFSLPTDRPGSPPTDRPANQLGHGTASSPPPPETGIRAGVLSLDEIRAFVREALASGRARLQEVALGKRDGKRDGIGETGSDRRSIGH